MIKLLNIVVLCAMCSCVLSEDDNILEEMTSAFKKMDTNNDGKVTIEEVGVPVLDDVRCSCSAIVVIFRDPLILPFS